MNDHRLALNQEIYTWLKKCEYDAASQQHLRKPEQAKRMMSAKLRFDLSSMLLGFNALCMITLARHPGGSIFPFRANSNIVENVFCQQRGHNGQNSNPTYSQYGPTMNSILLGQSTSTSRSNTGNVEALPFFKYGTLNKCQIND